MLFIRVFIFLGLLSTFGVVHAQNPIRKNIVSGNDAYNDGDYKKAAQDYSKAINKEPDNTTAHYNKGNALYKERQYAEARQEYAQALSTSKDKDKKAKAHHNIGNSYAQEQNYDQAIQSYKQALKQNPKDDETRQNLAMAKQRKKQQQKEQQQQKDNQQKPGDQQKPSDQQKPGDPKPSDSKPGDEQALDKKQAEKMLEQIDKNDQRLQGKKRGGNKDNRSGNKGKEW